MPDNPFPEDDAMERFVARFSSQVTGALSGFDRLVFRGTLIPLVRERGRYAFLCRAGIRLLGFKDFVHTATERLKLASLAQSHWFDVLQLLEQHCEPRLHVAFAGLPQVPPL